jgi:hypothetical protein
MRDFSKQGGVSKMLKRFWFKLDRGDGYGVTAHSRSDAESLLAKYGYPADTQRVVEVIEGVAVSSLDEDAVLPCIGPIVVRGVWFPCHNL